MPTMELPAEIKIGSDKTNDYQVLGKYVSPFHARIYKHKGQVMIQDLGSTFGTRVNNHIINKPTPLGSKDQISIGYHKLKLVDLVPTPLEKGPALTIKDLLIPGRRISTPSFRLLLLMIIAYPVLVFFGVPAVLTYMEFRLNRRRHTDPIEIPIWELSPYFYRVFGALGVYVTVIIFMNWVNGTNSKVKGK